MSPPPHKKAGRAETLVGWKEIANYLGKGVRSVQRYERELAMPIHRPAGKRAAAVFASKAELDRWLKDGPIRQSFQTGERTNKLRADFLQVDSEFALTYSGIALQTRDDDKRRRTTQKARSAYDAIIRLRKHVDLTTAESDRLDRNLERIKRELQTLGESF
jgi:hypothetical protein